MVVALIGMLLALNPSDTILGLVGFGEGASQRFCWFIAQRMPNGSRSCP